MGCFERVGDLNGQRDHESVSPDDWRSDVSGHAIEKLHHDEGLAFCLPIWIVQMLGWLEWTRPGLHAGSVRALACLGLGLRAGTRQPKPLPCLSLPCDDPIPPATQFSMIRVKSMVPKGCLFWHGLGVERKSPAFSYPPGAFHLGLISIGRGVLQEIDWLAKSISCAAGRRLCCLHAFHRATWSL